MKSKSQSAIEFVIILIAVMFFFAMFFLVIQESMSEKIKEKRRIEFESTALDIKREIDFAFESIDGYQRTFHLPEKINNKDYEISIISDSIYLRTSDNEQAIAISIPSIEGDLQKGSNFIRKIGGVIYLN